MVFCVAGGNIVVWVNLFLDNNIEGFTSTEDVCTRVYYSHIKKYHRLCESAT